MCLIKLPSTVILVKRQGNNNMKDKKYVICKQSNTYVSSKPSRRREQVKSRRYNIYRTLGSESAAPYEDKIQYQETQVSKRG